MISRQNDVAITSLSRMVCSLTCSLVDKCDGVHRACCALSRALASLFQASARAPHAYIDSIPVLLSDCLNDMASVFLVWSTPYNDRTTETECSKFILTVIVHVEIAIYKVLSNITTLFS